MQKLRRKILLSKYFIEKYYIKFNKINKLLLQYISQIKQIIKYFRLYFFILGKYVTGVIQENVQILES